MLFTDHPLTALFAKPCRSCRKGFAVSEGQRVNGADYADVADVVGGRSPVGMQVVGIGGKAGRVSGGGLIQRVSVVERL